MGVTARYRKTFGSRDELMTAAVLLLLLLLLLFWTDSSALWKLRLAGYVKAVMTTDLEVGWV